MKYCIKCGHEMKEEAQFCANCGQDQSKAVTFNQSAEENTNETVQQTITMGKNYLSYFLEKLKRPNFEVGDAHSAFGYITLGLFAFFQALLVFLEIKRFGGFLDSELSYYFPVFDVFGDLGFPDFLKLFVYFVLTMIVAVGVTYLIKRHLLHSKTAFNTFVNEFGALFHGILAISLLVSFCAFIDLTSFSFSVIVLLAGFFVTVIAAILLVTDDKKTAAKGLWSPFYTSALTLALIGLLDLVIMRLF